MISKRHAITAAHCQPRSDDSATFVRIGEWNTEESPDFAIINGEKVTNPKELESPINKWIVHDEFIKETLDNDIALLRLSKIVRYTHENGILIGNLKDALLEPLCLPFYNGLAELDRTAKLEIVGWGENPLYYYRIYELIILLHHDSCL